MERCSRAFVPVAWTSRFPFAHGMVVNRSHGKRETSNTQCPSSTSHRQPLIRTSLQRIKPPPQFYPIHSHSPSVSPLLAPLLLLPSSQLASPPSSSSLPLLSLLADEAPLEIGGLFGPDLSAATRSLSAYREPRVAAAISTAMAKILPSLVVIVSARGSLAG